MTETANLHLPLLSAAQAQKHVTMNEALSRIDAVVQMRLVSITETTPPTPVTDGMCYGVPTGAVNAWAGQAGAIAIAVNNGWDFIAPKQGFTAFVMDVGQPAIHDGTDWRLGAVSLLPSGAGMRILATETDEVLTAGASQTTAAIIPERAIVFGVTGRVLTAIAGPTSWRLGVEGDDLRYGSGLSTAQNAWISGPATPLVYWTDTHLKITSEGTDFSSGTLRLAIHYALLDTPNAV